MKHTPGPWKVFKPRGKSSRGIGPSEDAIVARALPCFYEGVHHAIANADLIAAAPELLEACQSFIDCWAIGCSSDKFVKHLRDGGFIDDIRNAIAKAEGHSMDVSNR